ncbi:hypothetical protein HRbin26_00827 [bacterium HR26]|nr:hypothetical protein HRbin26_00827 [bacterium HR26]
MPIADILIIVVFLGAYTLAFLGGIGRTLVGLVALFAAMVGAALFTEPLAGALRSIAPSMSTWASELMAFVITAALLAAAAVLLMLRSFQVAPVPTRRLTALRTGALGVLLLSLLAFVFATGVTAAVVQVASGTIHQLPQDRFGQLLNRELDRSLLAPAALRVAPTLYRLTVEWLPGEPPAVLRPPS